MKKPSKKDLDQGLKLVLSGKSVQEAMAVTGLNYSQLWLHGQAMLAYTGDLRLITGDSETVLGAQIVRARNAGESWGLIAVRCQFSESRVRRIFKETSGLDSRGLRKGSGGRFLADDSRFYTGGDRAKFGTEILPGTPIHEQLPKDSDVPKRKLPKVAASLARKASPKPRKKVAKSVTPKPEPKVEPEVTSETTEATE